MNPADAHHYGIRAEHLAGNDGRGRVCLLPGSVGRATRIAELFEDHEVHTNDRRMDVHLGRVERDGLSVDLLAAPTGMGCPSVGIMVTELIALGARRLLRIGTSGSLQPGSPARGLVIATGAVRDESTSDALAPRDVPALAHQDWVDALERAALGLGLGDQTLRGVVHSKDSLYGREFPAGPLADEHRRYMQMLKDLGVLATEMEASHLFTLAAAYGAADVSPISQQSGADVVKAGALLALIGSANSGLDPEDDARAAEARAVEVGVQAAVELIRLES